MSGRVRVTRARPRREREAVRDTSGREPERGGGGFFFFDFVFVVRFDRILASTD